MAIAYLRVARLLIKQAKKNKREKNILNKKKTQQIQIQHDKQLILIRRPTSSQLRMWKAKVLAE